jgi:hypothetical protein
MATTTKINYLILLNCFRSGSMYPTASSDAHGQYERIVTQRHSVAFIIPVVDLARLPALLSDRRTDIKSHPARCSIVGWGIRLQAGRSRVRVSMRWIFFDLPSPCSHTMALGSTQPLTEMSIRNLPGGKGLLACTYSWQPYRHLWADYLENVGASTSHNPMGLHGLSQG